MRLVLQGISWLALAGTILPAVLFFSGRMDLDRVQLWMLAATIAWFIATPFWMDQAE
jgi:hypothetical protein